MDFGEEGPGGEYQLNKNNDFGKKSIMYLWDKQHIKVLYDKYTTHLLKKKYNSCYMHKIGII
jgi:hypothetical protein